MKEDRERWNKRFIERPMIQAKTPGFIEERLEQLNPGTVIDIASGDGAAALYLAKKGFNVTAADISEVAIDRLSIFADKKQIKVNTSIIDLDKAETISQLGTFDNLVITHFKPQLSHWPLLISLLRPGGKLLISTFNIKHHIENGFSKRFCLEKNELIYINEKLALEHYASVSRNGSHMDDYQFRLV